MAHQESLIKTLSTSIMETVRFYADSGDLLSAAHITLIFYNEIVGLKHRNFEKYMQRILKSYFYTLE